MSDQMSDQKPRYGFLLPTAPTWKGTALVRQWAKALAPWADVTLLPPETQATGEFDLLFCTWWETAFRLPSIKAGKVAMLMQTLDAQAYAAGAPEQAAYQQVIHSGLPVITTAHCLAPYPKNHVQTIIPPRHPERSSRHPERSEGPLRFLIDATTAGPGDHPKRAMRLLKEMGCQYTCLETLDEGERTRAYRDTDVLLHLSSAFGMVTAQLEMFAAGGTAVLWDTPGTEEFAAHGYNSLVLPMNDFEAVERALATLNEDADLLARLKQGATATANAWPTWEDQGAAIRDAIASIPKIDQTEILDCLEMARKTLAASEKPSFFPRAIRKLKRLVLGRPEA